MKKRKWISCRLRATSSYRWLKKNLPQFAYDVLCRVVANEVGQVGHEFMQEARWP